MGKTTLTKRVFEDASVKTQFHSHAWVAISRTFKIELILKDLIQQLHAEIKKEIPPEGQSKDCDVLKVFLKGFLQERRYIIILDDIWSIDAWDVFQYVFPDCNCGSRVMLTTRIAEVADAACNRYCGYVYRMKSLSDEESWTLFCNKSFPDKCCPSHLESVSHRILKKCEGLPLAIASIGGLLFLKDKNRTEEWEKVYRSLGGELEGTGKLDFTTKILFLSYNDLDYSLKNCLLYTSLYPEDFEIRTDHLMQLWISEGFVQDSEGKSRVEVAEEYINELVNRSLLQATDIDVNGSIARCRIHDLVREITLSKAKEHGIITVMKVGGMDKARRLVIHDSGINDAQGDIQSIHFRSLVMFGYGDHSSTSSLLELLCGESKLLRILDLRDSPLEEIPKEVFKLFNLRHLNLRGSKVKVIPKTIKNLRNLEYLNLGDTEVLELPVEILKLGKLQELLVGSESDAAGFLHGFKAPSEIGGLLSLESLSYIDADNGEIVREIGKLTQLREFGITNLRREDGKQMCCSLEKLANLRKLYIESMKDETLDLQYSISTIPQFLYSLVLYGRLKQVPQWVSSLQGLTELVLSESRLTEDQFECLQVLPNLQTLFLFCRAYEGDILCFKARGFQKLKELFLGDLEQLRHINIEECAMPHLKELGIRKCKLMEELPQGIQNLRELQTVELFDMPKKLITELKKCEIYKKISFLIHHEWEDVNGIWYYL